MRRTTAAVAVALILGTVALTMPSNPSTTQTKGTTMSRLPETGPSLQRYLRQQARKAQRQQQSSAFNLSGTSVTAPGEQTVDGSLNVTGNLEVSGHAAITGTLSLPAGIINNDALASPVEVGSIYLDVTNFGLTTSWVSLASATVTVPAGFTSALVTVTGQVGANNPHTTGGSNSAGGDYIYCRPFIGATFGNSLGAILLGSNGWAYDITPRSTVLTGLTGGGTFTVGVQGKVAFVNMAADAINEAVLSGDILWFR